jgi:hypothetical protein
MTKQKELYKLSINPLSDLDFCHKWFDIYLNMQSPFSNAKK